eukprot:TRINITY_DN7793_c0_g5_i1.p1 TRINITY_DN7793_c0_g5~~TRINITY_DN7793_c0_g5_i1.p1  ORF type:complete len:370 (-),score=122.55 TRINITY_DN7793_c0_g5_i1:41-1150(-)
MVKENERKETKEPAVPNKESARQEKSDLNVAEDKKLEKDWVDEEDEPTSKPIKKTVKKKSEKHSKTKKKLRKASKKKRHHSIRRKKTEPECMREDQSEAANTPVAENSKETEAKTETTEEKEQEQLAGTKEMSLESQETTHGIEDLDVDCVAINDNATIVSDESGNSNYELVYMLFSFVDVESDVELNELLAGYFKGAALALLNGKPKEMAEFLESNLHVVDNLVLHSSNKSVAEVFCKVLSIEDEYFANPAQFSDVRKNSLTKILSLIEDPSTDVYSARQFTQTFCDLSDQSRDVSLVCCSMEFLRRIFAISLSENSSAASAGVTILTRLLTRDKSQLKLFMQEQLGDLPSSEAVSYTHLTLPTTPYV